MNKFRLSTMLFLLLGTISASAISAGSHSSHNMGHKDKHGSSSVGEPASISEVTQTIKVTANDSMRFEFSSQPEFKAGDVVKFIVYNSGKITHEFSIGDEKEQKSHNAMMKSMPNMVHKDGNTVSLKLGQTSSIIWKFKGHNEVVFACNVPGHSEAGMFHKTILK